MQLAGLTAHHASRHQFAHQVRRQGFGGDDAAAHRNKPSAQPAVGSIGIPVDADDDIARTDGTAGGFDLESVAVAANTEDGSLGVHRRTRGDRDVQHAPVQLCGMQTANIHANRAAEIVVRSKHRPLIRTGDRISLDAQGSVQHLGLARQLLVVGWRGGSGEPSGKGEIAVDLFLVDKAIEVFACGLGFRDQSGRALLAEALAQFRKAWAEIAAGNSAVAGRGAFAGKLAIEDLNRAAGACKPDGRTQASISGTDDDGIGGRRHGHLLQCPERRRHPPEDIVLLHF